MNKTSKKNIAKNSGFLYLRMLITMLISLYTTRVILSYLGEVNFGIYGVIWSLVSFYSFFNLSMTTAARRCLSFELGKGYENSYSQVLGILVKYTIIAGILIYFLQELTGSYLINNELNISMDMRADAILAYRILCFVFFLNILQIPFISSLISQEKITIYSYISIIDSILKLIVVLILSIISFDMLVAYCILLAVEQTFVFCLYFYYGTRTTKINFKKNYEITKEINKYLIWNFLGGLSSVSLSQGVQILISLFFLPVVNAAQTIAYQVRNAAETFTSNIRVSFNPPLIKSCAQGDNRETISLLSFSTRFSSIAVLLITVPLISKLDYILELWLVNPPQYTYIFCLLFLINSIIDNATTPIVSVIQASGDIKKYQIISSSVLLLILPITYFSYQNGSSPEVYGYYFIIGSIIILFIRIAFLKQIINSSIVDTFKLIFTQIITLPVLSLIFPLCLSYILEDSIINLLIISGASVISVILISWFIILNENEKKVIIQSVKSYQSKF